MKQIFIIGLLSLIVFLPAGNVFAATNIDNVNHWAWNDVIGWINFYSSGNVIVSLIQLVGYASSDVGYIALDCSTTPGGNICSGPAGQWGVTSSGGTLSGWAWNDVVGWISFNCLNTGTCGSVSYSVSINGETGEFSGWAWNDVVGWISFNCLNTGTCGSVDYLVQTEWSDQPIAASLTSSVFDTQVTGGSAINSILWQGTQPAGTSVKFQIASSNCSNGATNPPTCNTGEWAFVGPGGASSAYYSPIGPDVPVAIELANHNNKRYFRYKIFLESDESQLATPEVQNVIINWAP